MKYTKEYLEPFVKRNTCVSDVVRDIGIPCSGGNNYWIGKVIRRHGLDTSHFDLLEAKGRWKKNGRNNKKKTPEEILVYGRIGKRRERGTVLRTALILSGRENKCCSCGISHHWNEKPLFLEVHHEDGDYQNNRSENLKLMCPNCHSQHHQ